MGFGFSSPDSIEIRTPRLILRPLGFGDIPALFEAIDASRPFLERWLPWAVDVKSHGELRVFIDRCQRQNGEGCAHRGVFEIDGPLVGHMSIEDAVRTRRCADFGFWIREDRAGRGYTTEAAMALLSWGFRNLDLHRIAAFADIGNSSSARVLTKCGFTQEGVVRHRMYDGGAWHDHTMFGLLENELPSPRSR